ncbi:chromosome segregation protein SMC [Persicobacter sp. CCB-QB2]|uniref:chromosome segregation protein SMC n=1 Tax=Persicobacter sp. CCB-QB2 TaxID=1561025 RepID=UPI0006A9D2B1|nr:chromosome segregation protein SMC [Persicobacter sp. CCB-QB2]
MQLTSLEIKGFKSFGDRVEINFNEGITGIVGPNGCGKSNVVDAIRWVLGEQKTSALRSEKMENIIFNGTRNRKATNLAEVSLTFKNTKNLLPTEYHTVTISRRYYRSGDSEYLLNGVTCRLKDITGLFMDTGITSNSYAIIELRMVEEILNDKDNSRRGLFEEAAGISKFKARKKETLKKLKDTDADLERVEDLLAEIEKNMKSLERQAKTAKRYFKLKEDYKNFSLQLACQEVKTFRDQFFRVEEQLNKENDQRAHISSQIALKEAEVEKLKADLLNVEQLLRSNQQNLNQHVGKIRDYESDKQVKTERKRFLSERINQLKIQLEEQQQNLRNVEQQMQAATQTMTSAERMLLEVEAQKNQLESQKEQARQQLDLSQNQLESVISREKSAQQSLFQSQKDLEIASVQRSALKMEMEKGLAEKQNQQRDLSIFEDKLNDLNEEFADKAGVLEGLERSELELQENIQEQEHLADELKEQIRKSSRILDAKENEFQLKKSLMENLEGYPEALQHIRNHQEWEGKAAPLLSEIVDAPDRFRAALTTFLEPFMNYFIVPTVQEAKAAIRRLKEDQKGKAHFFLLDQINKISETPHISGLTAAMEVMESAAEYHPLLSLLLHRVYFVEHEKAIPPNANGIFVNNDGSIIQKKFSIGGGSVNADQHGLGTARQVEKLKSVVLQLEEKLKGEEIALEECLKKIASLKAESEKEQIDRLKAEVAILKQEQAVARTKFEQVHQVIQQSEYNQEALGDQLSTLEEEIQSLSPQKERLSAEIEGLVEQGEILKEQVDVQKEEFELVLAQFNEVNLNFHRQENALQSAEQQYDLQQKHQKLIQDQSQQAEDELAELQEEQANLQNHQVEKDEELMRLYAEREQLERVVEDTEKKYGLHRTAIDSAEKEAKQYLREKEVTDELVMKYSQALNEAKLGMQSTQERLKVEFEVDLEELLENTDPEQIPHAVEQLKQWVKETKSKLDRIGPINPLAVEAYNEIQERYTFINQQKEDLYEAKNDLMDTISQIDETARENFMEAFGKIKTNFIRVFRSLFTEEDDCDLTLSDPENPLESKIDIIAKPKGKRPLSISQLSGGEKTLTATSLLFAIYLLKPAPFCIFDEVDAPLDDANIDKFNNIIRTFSNESQFIIVTHNKRTMASTDIMYGVTMLEQGVSRVVPVDLRGIEEKVTA